MWWLSCRFECRELLPEQLRLLAEVVFERTHSGESGGSAVPEADEEGAEEVAAENELGEQLELNVAEDGEKRGGDSEEAEASTG